MARQFLASAADLGRRCGGAGCDGREDGAVEAMLQCQKVSDLLIAASFLSIPLELFYFATCANLAELKWPVLHFCAFIVLCGGTHLLSAFSHAHPHSAALLLALTTSKILAAVASSATAMLLLSFIPKLLRVKVRESLLRHKASRLHQDLGLVRRRVEATSRAPECSLPQWVIGDDKRVFHLLLGMVGTPLSRCDANCGACRLSFSVSICNVGEERCSLDWIPMRPSFSGCNVFVKFKVGIERSKSCAVERSSSCQFPRRPAATISSDMGHHAFSTYCNKIVQMMNGNMWSATDSGGVGESITLILQFNLQPAGHVQTPRASSQPFIPHFNGLKVLLADHDAMSREVTKRILDKLGCQVMAAPSGPHCLSMLASAEASFQLVILDLDCAAATTSMAMDSFEAALRIRELRNSCWLLIVVAVSAVSARAIVDDGSAAQEMCQRAGINGLVQKPVTLPALGAQLCRVLQDN
ncbi:hypothetical protein ABZP36_000579 [Zizania latifolia]